MTLTVAPALAERDPLLEVLIRKGILTQEEAVQIQKEARQLEKDREKKVEKQIDQKVAASEQKVTSEVQSQVAGAEKQVEKKTASLIPENLPEPLKGLKIGGQAFIDYSVGESPRFHDRHVGVNRWLLTRGYLNVEKEITPWLSARYTPDLHQDASGDWQLRQKYLYAELRPPNAGNVLTQMKNEIGLGHNPWFDFEEHIYPYRCQGTIPLERAGVMDSADIGINLRGNFGGQLPNAKEVIGDDSYDGRYGSWHLGVYNGCGYTHFENNPNKPIEYRLTLRPLPNFLPGLQATYFGLYGKGNSSSAAHFGSPFYQYFPDWIVHEGYLSYQHPWFILTAQMFATKGNQQGNWITQPTAPIGQRADSLWTRGYSVFGDVKLPLAIALPFWQGDQQYPLHAFYRTDWFNADQDQVIARSAKYTKLITGLAYYIYKQNLVLLAYERTWYGRDYGVQGGTGPNGTTATVATVPTNGGNLGTDQRFQAVFQLTY